MFELGRRESTSPSAVPGQEESQKSSYLVFRMAVKDQITRFWLIIMDFIVLHCPVVWVVGCGAVILNEVLVFVSSHCIG